MTRGRLSGKGEEDCDKDRKTDIDKANIKIEEEHDEVKRQG